MKSEGLIHSEVGKLGYSAGAFTARQTLPKTKDSGPYGDASADQLILKLFSI